MFDPQKPVYYQHPNYLPSTGKAIDIVNPATLVQEGRIAETIPSDLETVLKAANAAQKLWKALDAKTRATMLHRIASKIEATDMRVCAELMVREMGKPYPEAIGEVANCAGAFRYFAEMARDDAGKVAGTTQAGSFQYARYEPVGVSVQLPDPADVLDRCRVARLRQWLHHQAGAGDDALDVEIHGNIRGATRRPDRLRARRR